MEPARACTDAAGAAPPARSANALWWLAGPLQAACQGRRTAIPLNPGDGGCDVA